MIKSADQAHPEMTTDPPDPNTTPADRMHMASENDQAALPEAGSLLRDTHWPGLAHVLGPATDIPGALDKLLDDDLAVRACALEHLEKYLDH